MIEPLDVLAIMAHPDDAELAVGGTLIRSAEAGERTGVLDLTRGEIGTLGSPEVREGEANRAAEVMALAVRRNAGLPDGGLENTAEARSVVAGIIRELRPRVVVTHWIQGRHRDHRIAAELAYDASFLAGLKRLDAPGEPFRPVTLVHATAGREDAVPPSFCVDISPQMERKMEAVACYESQFDGLTQAGEIFPGGSRPLFEQIRTECAHYGSLIRVRFAEPFRSREALAVETLGALSVSTF